MSDTVGAHNITGGYVQERQATFRLPGTVEEVSPSISDLLRRWAWVAPVLVIGASVFLYAGLFYIGKSERTIPTSSPSVTVGQSKTELRLLAGCPQDLGRCQVLEFEPGSTATYTNVSGPIVFTPLDGPAPAAATWTADGWAVQNPTTRSRFLVSSGAMSWLVRTAQ